MTETVPAATEISLAVWLAAKEARAARQQAWLTRYQQPVISLTLVTPGAVKDTARYRNTMQVALQQCEQMLREYHWPVKAQQVLWLETGPEALWCVAHPAQGIKRGCITLEELHPLGRLWDFDVICLESGSLSRQSLGWAGRRCLLCHEPAHACSRSRRHPTEQVTERVEKMIDEWFAGDAAKQADCATTGRGSVVAGTEADTETRTGR